jgi:hypothetical protein
MVDWITDLPGCPPASGSPLAKASLLFCLQCVSLFIASWCRESCRDCLRTRTVNSYRVSTEGGSRTHTHRMFSRRPTLSGYTRLQARGRDLNPHEPLSSIGPACLLPPRAPHLCSCCLWAGSLLLRYSVAKQAAVALAGVPAERPVLLASASGAPRHLTGQLRLVTHLFSYGQTVQPVPLERLELSLLSEPDFESGASASFTTRACYIAWFFLIHLLLRQIPRQGSNLPPGHIHPASDLI